MDINAIPLFSMLKSRLAYVNAREKLISQNVANADTSNFAPKDLQSFDVGKALENGSGPQTGFVRTAMTDPGHLQPKALQSDIQWKVIDSADSDGTLSGNKVSLEDEMLATVAADQHQPPLRVQHQALDQRHPPLALRADPQHRERGEAARQHQHKPAEPQGHGQGGHHSEDVGEGHGRKGTAILAGSGRGLRPQPLMPP